MKIAIVTIHHLSNFGSVFQAYALAKYFSELGFDAEIIDYTPPYFPPKNLRARLGRLSHPISCMTREKKFRSFEKTNMRLSKHRYRRFSDFFKYTLDADIFIAGGDQLWNTYHPCGLDDVYKLTFTENQKMSYGTSMGRDNFSEDELIDLSSKIKDFFAVSVRESSSTKLLESVGIKATHVVDPVLLLNRKEYEKFITPPDQPKYLLVYLVTPSKLLDKTIEFVVNKLGLKVILCGGFSKRCYYDELLMDVGPEEVLSYLVHAEFVLSASFHATLFSLMFHKQFATLLPEVNTNERIEDLLMINEQQARIIRSESDIEHHLLEQIDYSKTDLRMEQNVEKSYAYIRNALNSCIGK